VTHRTQIFTGMLLSSAAALGVAVWLSTSAMREAMLADAREGLLRDARLAAELLARIPDLPDPDVEADTLAGLTSRRLTLIAADGKVIGDSEVPREGLGGVDNHNARDEVVGARTVGHGVALRHSATTGVTTMYAAVAVRAGPVRVVRVAVPLSGVDASVAAARRDALGGLGVALAVALLGTWLASAMLSRRLRAIAAVAERYRQGDFSQPARDYGGDEIGVVANTLDSTARALGSQLSDMARERAHTTAILSGMIEGVVLVDAAGRLVMTNPAVRSMLRLPEPAEGRHYLEAVRNPAIAEQLAASLAGRPKAAVEVELDRDHRRIYMASVVPVPAERGGGAVLVLHDVTDTRRADQVRRDFVANVSHELRTPLTAIRGYVEALLDGASVDGEQRKFLEVIARHALRMERLVRDLLRLARLDAGQEPLERVACAIPALVAAVEREMDPQLQTRQQRVVTTIDPDAATVPGDPAKLHDVLRNLLENAINYSPDGGTIEITAHRRGREIEIAVADRGPGIPEADLTRIFERFYRVDRSRTRDPGGTGLGLSIVRHLVELHGGKAAARLRDGGGSVVSIRLPAGAAAAGD
jgi:two-component system phosphate regulon sensor histidine kinase PhoR